MPNTTRHRFGLEVRLRTSDLHRLEILQTLEGLRRDTAEDSRGGRCEVYEDLNEDNRFLWTEWWPLPGDPEEVLKSERFRTLLGAIKVLGQLEGIGLLDQRPALTEGDSGEKGS